MSTRDPTKMPRRALRSNTFPDNKTADYSNEDKKPACELNYDVLTIIFKNLNARNLCNAAMVCRCWSNAAENEKRIRRGSPVVISVNLYDVYTSLYPGLLFTKHLRVKPMLAFMFIDSYGRDYSPMEGPNMTGCPWAVLRFPRPRNLTMDSSFMDENKSIIKSKKYSISP